MSAEKFVTIKELPSALEAFGIEPINYDRARRLVGAMRDQGMPVVCGRMVRPSDAFNFMTANQNWRPYRKNGIKA